MEFANPYMLWLFLIYIPLIVWYVYKLRRMDPAIEISNLESVKSLPTSYRVWLKHALFGVRLLAVGCLIVILSRPQVQDKWTSSSVAGTDIVIALDMSTSMMAQDFTPDRFQAAKEVASNFVAGRESDNIGLVVFAGECFTQTPMTTDKAILLNSIKSLEMGFLEDGTAIGDGLATAINRIVEGKAKSKSIILLTDGSNNTGLVTPETAAAIAREKGIKVYTIGVGTKGSALSPVGINYYGKVEYDYVKVTIDENTLQSIAQQTGGRYYRAVDKQTLKEIFQEIDALEKTEFDVQNYRNVEDNYMPWAMLLLALVCLDIVLRHTLLRNIP